MKVSKAGKICHPFRGGQFKWVGDIRRLVDGKWIKVTTTQGWLDGPESTYQICAQAPDKGIYSLFAYYTGPIESKLPTEESSCADGLTLIGSSPIDVINHDVNLIWNGTSWEDPIFSVGLSGFCSLAVFNTGLEPIDVVFREGNNVCTTQTLPAIEGSVYYAEETEEGTCPMQVYQAPD